MSIPAFSKLKFLCVLALASVGIATAACNTSKATIDTTVKFFSSTSPGSMFTADGMVEQKQKVNLFAGVAFENLRQDVAPRWWSVSHFSCGLDENSVRSSRRVCAVRAGPVSRVVHVRSGH